METESTKTAEDWFKQGLAQGRLGNNEAAITAYQKAVERDPAHFRAYFNMGIRYGNIPQNLKAVECFKKALQLRPDDAMCHYSLALVSNLVGLTGEAIKLYQEAIRLNPEFAKAVSNLAMLHYSLKRGKETIENLIKAEQLFAKQGDVQMAANAKDLLRECYNEFGFKPEDFN